MYCLRLRESSSSKKVKVWYSVTVKEIFVNHIQEGKIVGKSIFHLFDKVYGDLGRINMQINFLASEH